MSSASGQPGHHRVVPFRVEAVAQARRDLAASLIGDGVATRVVEDAAAVVSELLMNALVHGSPCSPDGVELWWCADDDGAVRLAVRDGGGGRPRLEAPQEDDGGGRGMMVVARLSASWTVDTSAGTRVEARIAPGVARVSPTGAATTSAKGARGPRLAAE